MTTVKSIVSKVKGLLDINRTLHVTMIEGWVVRRIVGGETNAGAMLVYHNRKLLLRIVLVADNAMLDFSQSKVDYFTDTRDRVKYNDYKERPVLQSDRNALNSVLEAIGIQKEFRITDGKLVLLAR